MGYALTWVEWLAAAVLVLAWVTACAARWSSPLCRVGVPALVALGLVGAAGAFVYGLGFLAQLGAVTVPTFVYFCSWGVALAFGVMFVLFRGLRRQGEAGPAARSWPRGGLGVAAVVVVVLGCITFSNMDLAMKVQMSALRAESEAKMLAVAPQRLLDRDNAAPIYLEAFASLPYDGHHPPEPINEKVNRWLEQPDFPAEEVARFLRPYEHALAHLHRASAKPACSFDRDYFAGGDLRLPEMNEMVFGAELLALDARVRARKGDVRGALEDVTAIFRMARHAGEPFLITLVIAAAMDRRGVAALEDVLAHAKRKPEEVAQFSLPEASYHRLFRRVLLMEEVGLGLPTMLAVTYSPLWADMWRELSLWIGSDISPTAHWALDSPLYRVYFLADDLAAYRARMKAFRDLASRPYSEAREAWAANEAESRRSRGGILTALLTPAAEMCAVAAAKADARLRLAELARVVFLFEGKTGKFPDRLDQLVPDYLPRLPDDPFTAQPLRDRREGNDLVLYSVGHQKDKPREITFRLRGK